MTRMGLHCHTTHAMDKLVHYCRMVRPNVVKTLDPSSELVSAVREASPGSLVVYRPYWADQRLDRYSAFTSKALDGARACLPDFVEGYNEWGAKDARELARFSRHEATFARAMNDAGFGALIGGFSTGHLDASGEMFDGARGILELCHERGGNQPRVAWHSHEYGGAYMQYMVRTPDGRNQWNHGLRSLSGKPPVISRPRKDGGPLIRIPVYSDEADYAARQGESAPGWSGISDDASLYWRADLDGWLCLRYRMLWNRLVEEGLTDVRMFLSETGIDDVTPRPGGQGKGWRDFHDTEWSRLPGIGDYADQQRWYGWHLSHDEYVMGWCDFGFGTMDHTWDSFDLAQHDAMFRRVIEEQRKLPLDVVDPDPPPPPPPPPPDPPDPPDPPPTVPVEAMRREADERQAIQLNPGASLYNTMRGDGFWPISDEFDVDGYRAQLSREWEGERERIYYCPIGNWDQVEWIKRR